MKKLSRIFLAAAFTLTTLQAAAVNPNAHPSAKTPANDNVADAPTPPPPADPDLNARKLFTRYMGIEVTRHLFREAQWELLATKEDTAYSRYFFSLNEYLGGLFDNVKKLHDLQLEQASNQFRHGKAPLAKGYTPYVNRILKTAQSAAESIGFPQAAIDNVEVFSQRGEMNAFTISGNHNRIIIALFTELMEQLSIGQLKGVLAHELGHIRLLHSVKGIMHNILMTVVVRSYAAKAYTAGLGEVKGLFPAKVCEHGIAGHVHKNEAAPGSALQSNLDLQMGNIIMSGINTLTNLPAEVRDSIIKQYVLLLLNSLEAEDGSPQAKQVLIEVLRLKPTFATEINGEKLMSALVEAQAAISRGQEKSADHISTSVVPNEYLANAMVQLGGPPMDPGIKDPQKKREELAKLREMLVDQMAKTNEKLKGTDRSEVIGMATHPPVGVRIDQILKIETFPEILFADPVLKLLLLEDQLQTAAMQNRKAAAETLEVLRRDILVLIESRGLTKKFNVRFDKAIQYAAFNRAANFKAVAALESAPTVTAEMKQGIAVLKASMDDSLELTRRIGALLEKTKATTPEEKAILAARKKMVADLLASDSEDKAIAAQIAARPANADVPVRNRRLLPVSERRLANPDRVNLCMYLLGQAIEADKAATAAKPQPPTPPPTAP